MRQKTSQTNPFLFEEDNHFQLRNTDFKDLLGSLPAGKADLVLTDPPYSISKKNGLLSSWEKTL